MNNAFFSNSNRPTYFSSLLTALGFFCVGAYFAFLSTDGGRQLINNCVKAGPSIVLAVWVLYKRFPDRSGWLVTSALVCTGIGDFLLEGTTELHFLLGIAANMVAHVLYIVGFTTEYKKLKPLRAIVPLLYIVGLMAVVLPHIDDTLLSVAVALYALIIGVMAYRAMALIGQSGKNRYDEYIGFVGALLFITCDTLIALNKFVAPIPFAQYWIMTSYWLGQWGIAYSIIILYPGQITKLER